MAVNKKNPYQPREVQKEVGIQKPWGLMLAVHNIQQALKAPNSVPSVILTNALVLAQAEQLDISVLSQTSSRPLNEKSALLVRSLIEASRRPDINFEQVLIEALEKIWVKKVAPKKPEPVVRTPKRPSKPKVKKADANALATKAVAPTVVVKKSRLSP